MLGFGLKVGHVLLILCCWLISVIPMNWLISGVVMDAKPNLLGDGGKVLWDLWEKITGNSCKIHYHCYQYIGTTRVRKTWWKRLLVGWVLLWIIVSLWVFCYMRSQAVEKRKEALAGMCDERARMLQDQFNVSMNHVQAMAILISTFHHGKYPTAIDQVNLLSITQMGPSFRVVISWVLLSDDLALELCLISKKIHDFTLCITVLMYG